MEEEEEARERAGPSQQRLLGVRGEGWRDR